jgi:hypothetical protein
MSVPKAIAIVRGFARNASDEKRLRAKGVTKLYRQDAPAQAWGEWNMRHGEGLGVVDGFRAFGTTRGAIMEKVRAVHAWGAVVVDAETGERSDQNGAEMLDRGLSKYVSETRAPSKEQARKMQERSVRARNKGRTPKREAAHKWLHSPGLSNEEVAAELTGWSWRALYDAFGPRKLPPGRRSKR